MKISLQSNGPQLLHGVTQARVETDTTAVEADIRQKQGVAANVGKALDLYVKEEKAREAEKVLEAENEYNKRINELKLDIFQNKQLGNAEDATKYFTANEAKIRQEVYANSKIRYQEGEKTFNNIIKQAHVNNVSTIDKFKMEETNKYRENLINLNLQDSINDLIDSGGNPTLFQEKLLTTSLKINNLFGHLDNESLTLIKREFATKMLSSAIEDRVAHNDYDTARELLDLSDGLVDEKLLIKTRESIAEYENMANELYDFNEAWERSDKTNYSSFNASLGNENYSYGNLPMNIRGTGISKVGYSRFSQLGIDSQVDVLASAVSGQETGDAKDPYKIANRTGSGAYGKYQIMPATWKGWAKTHLGNENAPQTPRNQEYVMRKVFAERISELGLEGAIIAHYAGYENGKRWRDGKDTAIGNNGKPYSWDMEMTGKNKGPSVRGYLNSVLGKVENVMTARGLIKTNETVKNVSDEKEQSKQGNIETRQYTNNFKESSDGIAAKGRNRKYGIVEQTEYENRKLAFFQKKQLERKNNIKEIEIQVLNSLYDLDENSDDFLLKAKQTRDSIVNTSNLSDADKITLLRQTESVISAKATALSKVKMEPLAAMEFEKNIENYFSQFDNASQLQSFMIEQEAPKETQNRVLKRYEEYEKVGYATADPTKKLENPMKQAMAELGIYDKYDEPIIKNIISDIAPLVQQEMVEIGKGKDGKPGKVLTFREIVELVKPYIDQHEFAIQNPSVWDKTKMFFGLESGVATSIAEMRAENIEKIEPTATLEDGTPVHDYYKVTFLTGEVQYIEGDILRARFESYRKQD